MASNSRIDSSYHNSKVVRDNLSAMTTGRVVDDIDKNEIKSERPQRRYHSLMVNLISTAEIDFFDYHSFLIAPMFFVFYML